MIQKGTLQFLKAIAKNNHKEWLDANRPLYESAKLNFTELISYCIHEHGKKDPAIAALIAKECLFRINRDIRFSKDKRPYKTNFGASIKPGGKKSNLAGYYIHIEPGGKSFIGGGMYMPEPGDVQKIRQEIDYNWEEFAGILKSRSFVKVFGSLEKWDEILLAREPKGYDKNNPAIEWLKLKSWVATAAISDQQIMEKDFPKIILQAFTALQPLLYFLNRAVGDE